MTGLTDRPVTAVQGGELRAPRRIVLFGVFGIGNLGNESTLWVTLHEIRRRLPQVELACVTDALPAFAREYGVTALPLEPLPVRGQHRFGRHMLRLAYVTAALLLTEPLRVYRTLRMLRAAGRLVVVGTGAFDDLGQQPWHLPTWILRWSALARTRGAQVQLLAVGVGPIANRLNRLLFTRAMRLANRRDYRDEYSRDYAAALGVAGRDDRVVPDLVFAWPQEWLSSPRAVDTPPKVVGVGLMEYHGWNADPALGNRIYDAYIEKMSCFVGWLVRSGYRVRLLVGERHTDARAVRDLLHRLGSTAVAAAGDRLAAPAIDSVHDVVREILLTDAVVATRFHNLVFALALGRPVLSIGYAGKFEALMHEMGLDAFCQRVEDLDLGRLQCQFDALRAGHEGLARQVAAKASEYRERLQALYDASFGPVTDRGSPSGFQETGRPNAGDPTFRPGHAQQVASRT